MLGLLQDQVTRVGEPELRAFASNVITTEDTHLRDLRTLQSLRPRADSSQGQ